jgi:dolichol-phosphate mannosyltransferase
MRAEILKGTELSEPHFAANVETGLKPLLAGFRIVEVPVSWINRTAEMGQSSFRLVQLAPNYFSALLRIVRDAYRSRRPSARALRRSRAAAGSMRSHD